MTNILDKIKHQIAIATDFLGLAQAMETEIQNALAERLLPTGWNVGRKYTVCVPVCDEEKDIIFSVGDVVGIDPIFCRQLSTNTLDTHREDEEFYCVQISDKHGDYIAEIPIIYLGDFLMEWKADEHDATN